MTKDGYRGTRIYYPSGYSTVQQPDGSIKQIPNHEIAMQIVETIRTGGVFALPSEVDANGTPRWKVEESQVSNNPSHILQYPKELDAEILNAMGIADDVLKSEATGSWAGKAVPQQETYCILEQWLSDLICDVDRVIEKLVEINFGPGHQYEITTRPLADQMLAQQNGGTPSANAEISSESYPSSQQIDPASGVEAPSRMGIDDEWRDEAPGMSWLRMGERHNLHAPEGGVKIANKKFEGGQFIPKNGAGPHLLIERPRTYISPKEFAELQRRSGLQPNPEKQTYLDQRIDLLDDEGLRQFRTLFRLKEDEAKLLLDALQMGADIAGLVDPTGGFDAGNGIVYVARGELGSAAISAAAVLPLGDLLKVLKAGKYYKIVSELAIAASKNSELAEVVKPLIKNLLDKIDAFTNAAKKKVGDAIPQGLLDELAKFKAHIQDAFKLADEAPKPPVVSGNPYFTRVDPKFPGRPDPKYSIDTKTFTAGKPTAKGGTRNAKQFWQQWKKLLPESLSKENLDRINGPDPKSPIIDDEWIKEFPEHAPYKGDSIIHHHVNRGKYAIPVPDSTHVGSGGPWHNK